MFCISDSVLYEYSSFSSSRNSFYTLESGRTIHRNQLISVLFWGPKTWLKLGLNNYYCTDEPYRCTDVHYHCTDVHCSCTDVHYRCTDVNYRCTDVHYRCTDVHLHHTDVHYRHTDVHYRRIDAYYHSLYRCTLSLSELEKAGILGILDTEEHFQNCKYYRTF